MKNSRLLTVLFVGVTAFFIQGSVNPPNPKTSFSKRIKYFSEITKAHATTFTDARDLAQMLYYMVNGDPASSDDNDGFVPMINHLLGPTALGGGLYESGYTTCDSIPLTGSASITEQENSDTQVFTMSFASPTLSIPSGWSGGGTSFDRRVEVSVNVNGAGANDFMIVELSCSSDSGYIKMDNQYFSNAEDIIVETYFQEYSTSGSRLEIHSICTDAGNNCGTREAMMFYFDSPDGDEFTILGTYAKDDTSDESARASLHGRKSVNLVDVKFIQPNSLADSSDVSGGTNVCVDFAAGDYDGSGQCGPASLTANNEYSTSAFGLSDFQIDTVNARNITAP